MPLVYSQLSLKARDFQFKIQNYEWRVSIDTQPFAPYTPSFKKYFLSTSFLFSIFYCYLFLRRIQR